MIYMKLKILFIIFFLTSLEILSQTPPVKHFTLNKENTQIPSDSLGTTYLYSLSFESNIDTLTSATFKLRGLATDSLFNTQNFNLPKLDGVYQTSYFTNGLIKDKNNYYIILGNIKSNESLQLISDFIDDKNNLYKDILTNE